LIDLYKTGLITLKASSDFSIKSEWKSLFFNPYKELIVAGDGSIFVSDNREHNIYKFDKNGNFIKKFGQLGEGPGDLYVPGSMSILDNKYLVVGEYAGNRRISIFDLEGNFFKLLKVRGSVYRPTSLKNNKIAYLSYTVVPIGNSTYFYKQIEINIIDAITNENIKVNKYEFKEQSIKVDESFKVYMGEVGGNVFIASTNEGNLLIGDSILSYIDIYSLDGKKIKSFKLNMNPTPVTKKYINEYKEDYINKMMQQTFSYAYREQIKALKKISISHLFADHIPYYYEIMVDTEGNVLIFKKTDCFGNCPIVFQVYSPQGKFICETELKKGPFEFDIDSRFNNICFTNQGIFGLFRLKGDEDINLQLVKVDLKINNKE
jgi:hypothetical protein